jgi:hypothetical protein
MHCLRCRRYEKAQKPLSAFDADISKYADLSEEVLAENAAESIKFLFVDCGPLKQVYSASDMCAFACKVNPEVACVAEVGHAFAISDDFTTCSTSMY